VPESERRVAEPAKDPDESRTVEHHVFPGALIMSTFEPAAGVAQHDAGAVISAPSMPRRGSQYAVLLRQVKQAGLLDRRTRYYLWRWWPAAGRRSC